MPTSRQKSVLIGTFVLILGAAGLLVAAQNDGLDALGWTGPGTTEQVENLRAFATLYGYVRYFHPSDTAADTDWEKFAIHGVREVKDVTSRSDLRSNLRALFAPIAPTVQLSRTGTAPPNRPDVLTPPDTTGLDLVAWQHRGLGIERDLFSPFRSLHLHQSPSMPTAGAKPPIEDRLLLLTSQRRSLRPRLGRSRSKSTPQ